MELSCIFVSDQVITLYVETYSVLYGVMTTYFTCDMHTVNPVLCS